MHYSLADIAKKIGATVHGDGDIIVLSLATLANANASQIAFLANKKYHQQLKETNAGAVILSEGSLADCKTNALVMANPYMGYALVAQLLDSTPKPSSNIHLSAVIADDAVIGENVSIGAHTVIESGVELASNVSIGSNCFIGKNAKIGQFTTIWSNISIYHEVIIGQHCLVQANTVIGSDGFGYANDKGRWVKIPQLGTVIIGDHVEIGASTTIDRGALENTEIKSGVILDNQIQIAHNVVMGENTAMAACSVIAGSTTIGKNCTIAGLVGINGHINISDGSIFTGMSMVTKTIKEPGVYSSGIPVIPNKDWRKMNVRLRKLDKMAKQIADLEAEVAQYKTTVKENKE